MKVVLAHGPGGIFDLFPLLFLIMAGTVIWVAMRDGQNKKTNTRTLPMSPLSRQIHAAIRKQRPERPIEPSSSASSGDRVVRRFGAPSLRVMDGGESADKNRPPTVPRRFEPAPPRRKSG
jgi:hypothetical protein